MTACAADSNNNNNDNNSSVTYVAQVSTANRLYNMPEITVPNRSVVGVVLKVLLSVFVAKLRKSTKVKQRLLFFCDVQSLVLGLQ